jgi:guanylate cyclase
MLAGKRTGFSTLLELVSRAVQAPGDSEDQRMQKTLLILGSLLFILAGLSWGFIYNIYGEPRSAALPSIYALVSFFSLAFFIATGRYRIYLLSQLALILVTPAVLMANLGGYKLGSAVILWALICPIAALLFSSPREARIWMIVYLLALAVSAVIEPDLNTTNALPETVRTGLFALNLTAVSLLVFFLVQYFITAKNEIQHLLQAEQEITERLLINVLPEEIAPRLKAGEVVAEHFDSASVMFADIVHFTELSSQLSPEEMVRLLNEIFSDFDELVTRYQLEKIRTVGDNYMVVSGVPRRNPDHAHALAEMALDIRDYMTIRQGWDQVMIEFRIGLNSGPMVGGVIGKTKFHYDVWGEAVNLASRLESQGKPGMIQVGHDMYNLLKEDFVLQPRGQIELKGVGLTDTWFLISRKE